MWGWLKGVAKQAGVQGLRTIANDARQFLQEKLPRAAQRPSLVTPLSSLAKVDTGQLGRMIDSLVRTGKLDPAMVKQLTDLNDKAAIDRVIAKFKAWRGRTKEAVRRPHRGAKE